MIIPRITYRTLFFTVARISNTYFVSGSTNPNISKEYNQAAEEFGRMLYVKKHNVIFDGCKGLPGIVASQLKQPNDNLSIATTSDRQIQWDDLIKVLEPLGLSHLYHVMDTPQEVMEYIEENIKINNSNYMAEYTKKIQEDDYER